MSWIVGVIIVGLLLFLVWASADIGSNIYLKTRCKGRTTDKVVALTFDDGPDGDMTPRVLDILKEYNLKATFFLIGKRVNANPQIVSRMYREGHIVANHTNSHEGIFPLSGSNVVEQEIEETNKVLAFVVGKRTKLFRPPFGVTNPIIGRVVTRKGLTTIGWSIRSLDTISSRSRNEVCEKVVRNLHPGAIILLHDVCKDADTLLNMLIPMIQEQGYQIVPLNNLLDIECYENED